jgi:hypothetical protein
MGVLVLLPSVFIRSNATNFALFLGAGLFCKKTLPVKEL